MNGNATYGDYVPDNWDPMKLSRDFLLTLILLLIQDYTIISMIHIKMN